MAITELGDIIEKTGVLNIDMHSADPDKLDIENVGTEESPSFRLDLLDIGGKTDDINISSSDTSKLTVTKAGTATVPEFTISNLVNPGGKVDDINISSADSAKLTVTKGGTATVPSFSIANLVTPGGKVDSVTITSEASTIAIKQNSSSTATNPSFNLEAQGGGKVDSVSVNSTDTSKITVSKQGTDTNPIFVIDPILGAGQVNSISLTSVGSTVAITPNPNSTAVAPSFNFEAKVGGKVDSVALTSSGNTVTITQNSGSTAEKPSFNLEAQSGGGSVVTDNSLKGTGTTEDPLGVNENNSNQFHIVNTDKELQDLIFSLSKQVIQGDHTISHNGTCEITSLSIGDFHGLGSLNLDVPLKGSLYIGKNNLRQISVNGSYLNEIYIYEYNRGTVYLKDITDSAMSTNTVIKNTSPNSKVFIDGYTLIQPEGANYHKGSLIEASKGSTTYIKNLTLPDWYKDVMAEQYVISDGAIVISEDSSADTTKVEISTGGKFYPSVSSSDTSIVTLPSLIGDGTIEAPLGVNETTETIWYSVESDEELLNFLDNLKNKEINHLVGIDDRYQRSTLNEIHLSGFHGRGKLSFSSGFKNLNRIFIDDNDIGMYFSGTYASLVDIGYNNKGYIQFSSIYDNLVSLDPVFSINSPETTLDIRDYYCYPPESEGREKGSLLQAYYGTVYIGELWLPDWYNPIGSELTCSNYRIFSTANVISTKNTADTLNVDGENGGYIQLCKQPTVEKYCKFAWANNVLDTSNLNIFIDKNMARIYGSMYFKGPGQIPDGEWIMKLKSPLLPSKEFSSIAKINYHNGSFADTKISSTTAANNTECVINTVTGFSLNDAIYVDFTFKIKNIFGWEDTKIQEKYKEIEAKRNGGKNANNRS